jgi:hypothetical protein
VPDITVLEDSGANGPYNLTQFSFDADGDPLTFMITAEDLTKVDCSVIGASLTVTPAPDYNGVASCSIVADDGYLNSSVDTFDIIVLPVNDPPRFNDSDLIPPQIWPEDTVHGLDLAPFVTDVDGDVLTFTATPVQNISVSVVGSVVTFVPEANFNGVRTVVFTADDGHGGVDSSNVVVLNVTPVNDNPVITSTPILTGLKDALYTYDVDAKDVDMDILSYSLTLFPAGMVIDPVTGLIQWTPSESQVGNSSVTARVDDGYGGFATQSWVIRVASGNEPPFFNESYPIPDQIMAEDTRRRST